MTVSKLTLHVLYPLLITFTLLSAPLAVACETPPPGDVADQFSQALKNHDEVTIRALLDENVLIFESGGVESSLEEYASHHMSADMAFMEGMEKEITCRTVQDNGDMAVVSTQYRMFGSYKGKDYDRTSLETLVLKRTESGWKIVHIHWS